MLKSAYANILESSTLTLSAATEDAAYPLARLCDRNVGRVFQPTAAETLSVDVDQGAVDIAPVNALIISAGHNLHELGASAEVELSCSDDDVTYTVLHSGVPQDGAAYAVELEAEHTHRYWRVTVTNPPVKVQMTELFLTLTYVWQRGPSLPVARLEDRFTVEAAECADGSVRYLEHGVPRRRRSYHVQRCARTQMEAVAELYTAWGGLRPFWLLDHEGRWLYGRLTEGLQLTEAAHERWDYAFSFEEVRS